MPREINFILECIVDPSARWKLKLLTSWPSIVGNIAQHARIEKILDDHLIIGVYDSCWLQELYYLSHSLLEKINHHVKNHHFKSLKLVKVNKKPFKKNSRVNHSLALAKEVTLTSKQKDALEKLHDPELAQAMQKFLHRCAQE